MVEGVGYFPGAPGMDSGGAGIWWGENLAGAKVRVNVDRGGSVAAVHADVARRLELEPRQVRFVSGERREAQAVAAPGQSGRLPGGVGPRPP